MLRSTIPESGKMGFASPAVKIFRELNTVIGTLGKCGQNLLGKRTANPDLALYPLVGVLTALHAPVNGDMAFACRLTTGYDHNAVNDAVNVTSDEIKTVPILAIVSNFQLAVGGFCHVAALVSQMLSCLKSSNAVAGSGLSAVLAIVFPGGIKVQIHSVPPKNG